MAKQVADYFFEPKFLNNRSLTWDLVFLDNIVMITVTLHEAKAKLNQLVEAAKSGEQVVLLRGSAVVATLVPLDAKDLEIAPQLTDRQAKRFWDEIRDERSKIFPSPAKAVALLKKRHS